MYSNSGIIKNFGWKIFCDISKLFIEEILETIIGQFKFFAKSILVVLVPGFI